MTTPLAMIRRRVLPGPWTGLLIVREGMLLTLLAGAGALIESIVPHSSTQLVAIMAGIVVLGLVRRGLPATALIVVAAGAGTLAGGIPVLLCVAWSAGHRITGAARAGTAFGAAALISCVVSVLGEWGSFSPFTMIVTTVMFCLISVVLPGVAGRYRAQRRTLLRTFQERNAQLLRERAMVAHQARLRERHRIAQDMHDSLGHQLALIAVHTGALQVDRDLTGRQHEAVGVLREASVGAMRELREVVGILREDDTAHPVARVVAALDTLAESSRAAGAVVEVTRTGTPRPVAPAADHAAYRIVQEGLTNAHKHAPGAPITVGLRYEPDTLVVEVSNGPAPEARHPTVSGGQGLTGLRERARLVGGMVHAGPTGPGGFRVAGVLPYESATLVEPGNDFREQTGIHPLDEIDRMTRQKNNLVIGCSVAAAVVLAFVALVVWGGVQFFQEMDKATVSTAVYDSVEVGSSEEDALAKLPEGSDLMTDTMEGQGPEVPEGATCRHFMSSEQTDDWSSEYAIRFCFKDGVLVDKKHFRAKI